MTAPVKKSTLREYFESIVIAVILALFVRTWIFQAFKIPTGSMEPNLLIGDHLIVNKFIYAPTASGIERRLLPVGEIRRGDVVVFKYPEDPERDFIKRVIGLPGETLEVRDKRVYIDGRLLEEPYVFYLEPPGNPNAPPDPAVYDVRSQYGPVTIPPDSYFMMGDNRDNSQDSRYWGVLPRAYVKGKALVIYWSYETGDGEPAAPGGGGALRRAASAVVHLLTRTRWDRIFRQIR